MNEWINECPRLFLSLIRIAKSSQINKIKTDKRSSFTRVPSILDDGMFVNSMRSETIYGVFCFKWKTWENIFLHWKSKEKSPTTSLLYSSFTLLLTIIIIINLYPKMMHWITLMFFSFFFVFVFVSIKKLTATVIGNVWKSILCMCVCVWPIVDRERTFSFDYLIYTIGSYRTNIQQRSMVNVKAKKIVRC